MDGMMKKMIHYITALVCLVLCISTEGLHGVCDQAWSGDNVGDVIVLSTETQTQTSLFMPGDLSATGIAFTPDGTQVFLTDLSLGVWAINAATQIPTQVSMQENSTDIVVSPDGQFAYAAGTLEDFGFLLIINTSTYASTIMLYPFAVNGVAITPDGSQLYLVGGSTAFIVDPNGNVLQMVPSTFGTNLLKVAITPDGAFAYVTDNGAPGGGAVFQINTSDLSVATVSTGVFPPFNAPWGVTIHPSGQFVYVTDQLHNSVDVIQVASNTVVNEVFDPFISTPQGIAATPNGNFVYVAEFGSNVISVINTSNFAVNNVSITGLQPVVITMAPPCISTQASGRIVKNQDVSQTDLFSQLIWTPTTSLYTIQYLIYRNGVQIANLAPNITHFEDHYLRHHKKYAYSIFAVNGINQEILIAEITLTTE